VNKQTETTENKFIVLLLMLLSLAMMQLTQPAYGFDAPPKDQGHSGPGSGNRNPNNPNGTNQGQGGDPVHIRGGNFTTEQEDLLIMGQAMPIYVKRTYNSHDNDFEGPVGFGWSFSYHVTALELRDSTGKTQVVIRDGDGIEHVFTQNVDKTFAGPIGRYNKLVKVGANAYQVTRKDAVKLLFSSNRLDAVVDPNGNRLSLTYAADGKLITVTSPSNRSIQISYGSNNKINKITDPLNRSVAYAYNSKGDLISVTNLIGNTTRYSYDDEHHLLTITDPNGAIRLSNTYNDQAQITEQISDGRKYQYTYQKDHTRVRVPNGRIISHYFNDQGNKIRRIDQLGNSSFFVYDENSSLIEETDARGNVTQYTYDDLGNVATITDADGKVTVFATDPVFGVLTKVVDSLGRVTTYSYDGRGNLVKKTDASGKETSFAYNAKGQVIKTTDEAGKNLFLAYSAAGDLISVTDALGGTIRFEYDIVGRRIKLINALGHATSYRYDALDRLVASINALVQTISYDYDKLGNVLRVTDANNNSLQFNYDQFGLLTSIADPEGYITTYSYDVNGNLTQMTDPLGNQQIAGFDAANQLVSIKKPDNSVTSFAFDKVGNNTRITDPLGNETNFVYDKLNRVISTIYAEGRTQKKTYDSVGNVTIYQDRAGKSFGLKYDDLDRLIKLELPGGDNEQITYNTIGFIAANSNKNGNLSYTFDEADRLVTITDVYGNTFSYEYDAVGRRIKMTDADGLATLYKYDAANRMTEVTRQSATTRFSYDAGGRLLTRTLPNGIVSEYTYDKRDLITRILHKAKSGQVIASYHYQYDATGKRTQVSESDGTTTSYEYDPAYRLIRVTKKAFDGAVIFDYQYEYDANGNRTRLIGDSEVAYSYNNLSQLIADGLATYSYDDNGNLIEKSGSEGITRYQYDDNNQLTKVIFPDASEWTSKYDAEGKRIEQDLAGQISRFVFDNSAVYGETDNLGAVRVKYNRSLGLISQERNGTKSYFLTDALGSVRQLVSAQGNVTDTYSYDAFGNILTRTGTTINPYQFAGSWGYYSFGSLTHIGARYYAPSIGRFISMDPLYQGTNWYSYALNDPVNLVDPDGRWVHIAIGAGLGALVNTGVYLYSTPRDQWSLGGGLRAAGTGAVVGGVGAATFGASMPATLGGAVARGALSGLAGQAASDLTNSAIDQKLQISSPSDYARSAALGGALGGVGYGASRAVQSYRNSPRVCCFVAGTAVIVSSGYKNIEDIKVGDLVLAKNIDSGEKDWKPVTKLYKKFREIYELKVVTDDADELTIETTDDHPFYVKEKGWVNTIDLKKGDRIESSKELGVIAVINVRNSNRMSETFNLEVAEFHTYYATRLNLLVHNCNTAGKLSRFLRNKIKRIKNQTAGGGNRGISGSVSEGEALRLGREFVGPGFRMMSNGRGYVSADGLRTFRFPASKGGVNPATGKPWSNTGRQVNFESKVGRGEVPTSNVHLDVR
jgi:RHS repeat-associated protein